MKTFASNYDLLSRLNASFSRVRRNRLSGPDRVFNPATMKDLSTQSKELLYNTLSKEVAEFAPLVGNMVRMYICGPNGLRLRNFVEITEAAPAAPT